jgi:hypothetical protein
VTTQDTEQDGIVSWKDRKIIPDIDIDAKPEYTPQAAAAAVAALGTSADEIATSLARHGYTGRIGDPGKCPLANYLTDHFKGRTFRVGVPISRSTFSLPNAATEFVRAFDVGEYPDLASGKAPHPMR